MSQKKLITVLGATGKQGSSVVETFLNDPKLNGDWTVRGVTRDTSKEASQRLSGLGVEMVSADLNNKDSLVKAFKGSYAVFAVTNYWESLDMQVEIQQGKNIADAAKETDVKFLIWSSQLNIKKLSNGVLSNLYHFDSKAIVEEYIRELGIPATFFLPGFYMSNVPGAMFRPSAEDAAWTFALPIPPTAIFPMYYTGDTGKYIKGAVLHEKEVLGKRILGATAYMTGQEIVDGFKRVFPESGKTARYYRLSEDQFRGAMKAQNSPDYVIDEMHQNMRLLDELGYYGGESLDWTHQLVEDRLTSWEEFAKADPGFASAR
ncbi:NmrA-like family domain-containing protein 1 [Colletotrichum fructicola]|nr:NmrA-like family domain-containing protein 1 [Colletotrichum fructicola]